MTRPIAAARAHIAADYTGRMFTTEQTRRLPSASIDDMDSNTLLIIVIVLLVLGSGGFFYRGRLRR
jgi:hypothetical protein